MYRFTIIGGTVRELWAFENAKKVLTQQKMHILNGYNSQTVYIVVVNLYIFEMYSMRTPD